MTALQVVQVLYCYSIVLKNMTYQSCFSLSVFLREKRRILFFGHIAKPYCQYYECCHQSTVVGEAILSSQG